MVSCFAVLLAVFCIAGVHAEAATEPEFTIKTEEMLMQSAGQTAREWDDEVQNIRLSAAQASLQEEDLLAANEHARILKENGKIYMIDGAQGAGKISGPMDAYLAVYRMRNLLGGNEKMDLRLWSMLQAGNAARIYAFQEVYEGLTVVGSTVRLITDADGNIVTVLSSLSAGVPERTGSVEITADEAEDSVRSKMAEMGQEADILKDFTTRAVMPLQLSDEEEEERKDEALPEQIVWIVYSYNPNFATQRFTDLPYLAHCVGMDGTYIMSMAVTYPGDIAERGVYVADYAFEFMESDVWTGEVTQVDGTTATITVPVMRDTRTGMWYLGDVERKIVVGDFSSQAYGEERVKLIGHNENSEWNDDDLITYSNMLKVWDFYANLGWKGADGIGTPILLLSKIAPSLGF